MSETVNVIEYTLFKNYHNVIGLGERKSTIAVMYVFLC